MLMKTHTASRPRLVLFIWCSCRFYGGILWFFFKSENSTTKNPENKKKNPKKRERVERLRDKLMLNKESLEIVQSVINWDSLNINTYIEWNRCKINIFIFLITLFMQFMVSYFFHFSRLFFSNFSSILWFYDHLFSISRCHFFKFFNSNFQMSNVYYHPSLKTGFPI